MNSSAAGVKRCLEDVRMLQEIWHAQVCATVGATAISPFWENSLVQINSKLNSKPYDYLYVSFYFGETS